MNQSLILKQVRKVANDIDILVHTNHTFSPGVHYTGSKFLLFVIFYWQYVCHS